MFSVGYELRFKKQLSIKHRIQHKTQPDGSTLINESNVLFAVRAKEMADERVHEYYGIPLCDGQLDSEIIMPTFLTTEG
jgi:hypothetical protein